MRSRFHGSLLAAGLAGLCWQPGFAADTVFQSPADFYAEYLPGCERQALWLDSEARSDIEALTGHPFAGARVRYCRSVDKTGWILDEIGKTEPITSGIVVDRGRIERVRVLIFRESRGAEVHREAFVRQYEEASLEQDGGLDRRIDGITGATLSVYAVSRQAKLALLLDGLVREQNPGDSK